MNTQVQTPQDQQVAVVQPAPASQLPAATGTPNMKDLAAMPIEKAIDALGPQFATALPSHIPMERFRRVVMTAVSSNPDLARADRRSLFNSCVKAAQDGLLPDGRDGALVVYNTSVKITDKSGTRWDKVAMVQWLPMIAGFRKKIRNSGQIADLWAEVVYAKDVFDYQLGLARDLIHKPAFQMPLKERGEFVAAYSVAKFKDGSTSFDVMSADEIWETWRKASKQKDKEGKPTGMWKDYPAEAFKKTVVKRHSKQLPMSSDLDDLLRDDDALYDFEGKSDRENPAPTPSTPRPQITDYTDVQQDKPAAETVNAETGEIITEGEGPAAEQESETATYGNADAYNDGQTAFGAGVAHDKVPGHIAQLGFAEPWQAGWKDAEADHDAAVAAKTKADAAKDDKANTGKLV